MIEFELINDKGYTYRYKEAINDSDKNILFIHGFGTNSNYHDDYIEPLILNHNYYALQLPGSGYCKVKHKSQLDPIVFANYVSEFIKSMNLSNLTLIGHSMGGGIGVMVANLVSDKIAKLILVTPMNSSAWYNLKNIKLLNRSTLIPNTAKKNWKMKTNILKDPKKFYINEEDEKLKEEVDYFLKHEKDFKILRKNMMSLGLKHKLQTDEKNNPIKTLVILGTADGLLNFNRTKARLSKFSNYQIEIFEDSGHVPFAEETQKYNETVLNFINQ